MKQGNHIFHQARHQSLKPLCYKGRTFAWLSQAVLAFLYFCTVGPCRTSFRSPFSLRGRGKSRHWLRPWTQVKYPPPEVHLPSQSRTHSSLYWARTNVASLWPRVVRLVLVSAKSEVGLNSIFQNRQLQYLICQMWVWSVYTHAKSLSLSLSVCLSLSLSCVCVPFAHKDTT